MKQATEALLKILEHPHLKKGYKEFKIYLESCNRNEDVAALDYLLSKKFPSDVIDNSNSHQEQ